jgi:hypothetical protein
MRVCVCSAEEAVTIARDDRDKIGFGVLGPLQMTVEGAPVPLGTLKQCTTWPAGTAAGRLVDRASRQFARFVFLSIAGTAKGQWDAK